MKRTKQELIETELEIMAMARQEKKRDLGVTSLYQAVKILSSGTRFEADCLRLCREMDALWADTRGEETAAPVSK